MNYWLFKSEPTTFSIDHLHSCPKQTTCWDGVRNYQARNMLRDQINVGDKAFFYHSNCTTPGIVGLMEIVKTGYPDFTAFDEKSDHFDPDSDKANPRWYMVDVRFIEKFKEVISLDEIKKHNVLKKMVVARKGNRLSITPVSAEEYKVIMRVGEGKG